MSAKGLKTVLYCYLDNNNTKITGVGPFQETGERPSCPGDYKNETRERDLDECRAVVL